MTISLYIPIPPSLNNSTANRRGGRRSTERYKAWKEAAGWEIKLQKPEPVIGPYRLTLFLPWTMAGDISNRIKAAEDLLVSLGVTPDDRHAVWVCAQRSNGIENGRCRVEVEEVMIFGIQDTVRL